MDDLEDILNSPAPALDNTSNARGNQTLLRERRGHQSAFEVDQPHLPDTQLTEQPEGARETNEAGDEAQYPQALTTGSQQPDKDSAYASLWNTACHSASIPLTAAWAYAPRFLLSAKDQKVLACLCCLQYVVEDVMTIGIALHRELIPRQSSR